MEIVEKFDIINTYNGLIRIKSQVKFLIISPPVYSDENDVKYFIGLKDGEIIEINKNLVLKKIIKSDTTEIIYEISIIGELSNILTKCVKELEVVG